MHLVVCPSYVLFFCMDFCKKSLWNIFPISLSYASTMVPRSNKSIIKGTEVKKLSTVTMWPRLSNSYRRFVTTSIAWRPSPFPLYRTCSSSKQGRPLSLKESYSSSSCRFLIFLQYTLKFHKYFNIASAAAQIFNPNLTSLYSMYCLMGQYLPL